jgi:cytolysin (calcineurin-like family phosphatase)
VKKIVAISITIIIMVMTLTAVPTFANEPEINDTTVDTPTTSDPAPPVQPAPVQASTGIFLNGQNVSTTYGYSPDDILGILNVRLTGTALDRAQYIIPELIRVYIDQVTEGAVIMYSWDGRSQPSVRYTSTASVTVTEPVVRTPTTSAPAPSAQPAPVQASTGIFLNGQNVSTTYGYNPDDILGVLNVRLTGTALARAEYIVPELIRVYIDQVTEGAVIMYSWDGRSQPSVRYTSTASITTTR